MRARHRPPVPACSAATQCERVQPENELGLEMKEVERERERCGGDAAREQAIRIKITCLELPPLKPFAVAQRRQWDSREKIHN